MNLTFIIFNIIFLDLHIFKIKMSKSFKKNLKSFLKLFDYFGLKFNFHYKSNYNYRSVTGGLTFIIFIICSICYVIIQGIHFIKRNNMSLIYNDRQIQNTKNISFTNYSNTIAFGISCGNENLDQKLLQYITIDLKYVSINKNNGQSIKEKIKIPYSNCKKEDFFNEFNQTFIDNSLDSLYCPNDLNSLITGTYTQNFFSYYDLTFEFNCKDENCFNEIISLFHYDECQINLYYIDTFINVNDYKNPIKRFLTDQFLVLKPDEHLKMNLYFKIKSFDSYENYILDNHKTKYFLGFSSSENYSIKKGYDRFLNKDNIKDYNRLATIYLRSATIYTVIERKYMKLTEFAAQVASLISTILLILYIIMYRINIFYGYQSVIKKIFQFKGRIKLSKSINETKIKLSNDKDYFNKKNVNDINNDYNINFNHNFKGDNSERKLNEKSPFHSIKFVDNKYLTSLKTNDNLKKQIKNNNNNYITRKNNNLINNENKEFSYIQYNVFEILIYFICPCFSCKKLRDKNILFNKGKKQLFFQLDIVSYLRKVQQIELLNYILLDPGENVILNFLSKPLISYNNRNNFYNKIALGYNNISEKEIENFIKYYKYLFSKQNKNHNERRIFNLSTVYINSFIKDCNEN